MPEHAKSVLDFWYGHDFQQCYKLRWFPEEGSQAQNAADLEITDRFSGLLEKAENEELMDWESNPQTCLALIIVLDQFSRHIYRQKDRSLVERNDTRALKLTHLVLERGWDRTYSIEELVFALMPLRHTPTIERLVRVLSLVDERAGLDASRSELLAKFRRATLRRLQDLEGKAGDPADILEFHPFDADESGLLDEPLTRTVEGFLRRHDVGNWGFLMTSLSGGVDSMVLTYILHRLRPTFNNYQIIACHVDYGNRPESGAEADYVEQWCAKHDVIFRKRLIDEVKRAHTPRDEYEKMSRVIRYDLYKTAMTEVGHDVPAVMVGHHKGDVQENVISNMMKGCSLVELAGMYSESVVNGVLIWRPMLTHPKDDIFGFAHKYGIPYFKDTTPKWSTRGKLRNQLLPLLADVYGAGFPQHLSNAAADSEQLHAMVHQSVLAPFWVSMRHTPMGVSFNCAPHLHQPLLFWKESFKHVCHDLLGIGLVSERPINMLLSLLRDEPGDEMVNNRKTVTGYINMKKSTRFYLAGTVLYIFDPVVFPSSPYFQKKTPLTVGQEYKFGPWVVSIATTSDSSEVLSSERLTLDDLWAGEVSYSLPLHPDGYVVDNDERPKVFRQLDKTLTNQIPIVRCSNIKARRDSEGRAVRVRLKLAQAREEALGLDSGTIRKKSAKVL